MSLYPSLEDMQVGKMIQAQDKVISQVINQPQIMNESTIPGMTYPDLMDCLGLEMTNEMIRENMPEYMNRNNQITISPGVMPNNNQLVAPVTGQAAIPSRAQVTHNIREAILCKGVDGKVGIRVQSINTGIFVSIVVSGSPAAIAGIRFGDQILQLNGELVVGYSVDKLHKLIKSSDKNNISIVLRDRPFARTITLVKNLTGHVGFQFKDGRITAIVKDSSAAKNGVLIDHNLLEVNGQNVVALKDKDICKIMDSVGDIVKITIIPSFLYDQMIKKLPTSYLRGIMDHNSSLEF